MVAILQVHRGFGGVLKGLLTGLFESLYGLERIVVVFTLGLRVRACGGCLMQSKACRRSND